MTIARPDSVRFEEHVDRTSGDGCHLWTGATTGAGYGSFRSSSQRAVVFAHRFALAQKLGRPLRRGEYALHTCDNPSCVNPDHLYPGDQAQNMRDRRERGRARNQNTDKASCIRGHRFTPENTHIRPNGKRTCRSCEGMYPSRAKRVAS